jgi:hypothetical protein
VETEVKRSSGCTLLSQGADSGRHGTWNGRTLFLVVFGTTGFHGEQLNGGFVSKQPLPSKCPNKRISILVLQQGFANREGMRFYISRHRLDENCNFQHTSTQRLLLSK